MKVDFIRSYVFYHDAIPLDAFIGIQVVIRGIDKRRIRPGFNNI